MKKINLFLIATLAIAFTGCKKYHVNHGTVFGTYYNIQYESRSDLQDEIEECLKQFDNSLSVYNENSIISRINRNEDVVTDAYFERMFEEAQKVSQLSNGAFDITVAPLVNLWGFGFKNEKNVTQEKIDSILPLVNYKNVQLKDHHIIKSDPRIMLDASALAKGYACDVIADMLREHGCENFLVDIGGEVVAEGENDHGKPWAIGITKPIDDVTGTHQELQDKVETSAVCMATSGNYRNYYINKDNKRCSHTIDPRKDKEHVEGDEGKAGYPVHHSLLSATIVAPTCLQADALATACMVMGEHEGAKMITQIRETAYYFIIADSIDGKATFKTQKSQNWDLMVGGGY